VKATSLFLATAALCFGLQAQTSADSTSTAATFEEFLSVLPAEGGKYSPLTEDGTAYWESGSYSFSCTRSYEGMMNDGFYPANWADTTYTDYSDDYKALPCGGVNGSQVYASLYYGGAWGGPCNIQLKEAAQVSGTYVTLALNPYLCIHGKSWCAAFADGDYLYLHFTGKKEGAETGTSADFYLADYRDGKRDEVTDWQWFDLTPLGVVDQIEVSIIDSQNGAGVGLYACFDDFGGTAPTTGISHTAAKKADGNRKMLRDGRLIILYNGTEYKF